MSQWQHRPISRQSLKHILLGGISGGIGILGVIFAVALYIVETLIRPRRSGTFVDLYTFTPFELNLPAEEIAFQALNGDHLVSGWYVSSPQASATIIICPGYRGRRSDVLGMAGQLWRAGYNVLAFEYYGHGTVVGKPVTLGYREINDFLGAVAYARQRAPHTRLGAVGYSMGASVSIMGCARTTEVDALVADSGFATHRSAIEYAVNRTLHLPYILFDWVTDFMLWWRAGYHFKQVEPLRDIAHIAPRPILIIHGLQDTMVNPRDASLLYAAAKEPKELWLVPGVDHCGAYFADRVVYTQKVIGFFDLHLRTLGVPAQPLSRLAAEEQGNASSARDLPEAS